MFVPFYGVCVKEILSVYGEVCFYKFEKYNGSNGRNSMNTFYPGIGADDEMNELKRLVGDFTAYWTQVEDGMFQLFVVAIAGDWLIGDIRDADPLFPKIDNRFDDPTTKLDDP